jgi:hypothetical protein
MCALGAHSFGRSGSTFGPLQPALASANDDRDDQLFDRRTGDDATPAPAEVGTWTPAGPAWSAGFLMLFVEGPSSDGLERRLPVYFSNFVLLRLPRDQAPGSCGDRRPDLWPFAPVA